MWSSHGGLNPYQPQSWENWTDWDSVSDQRRIKVPGCVGGLG